MKIPAGAGRSVNTIKYVEHTLDTLRERAIREFRFVEPITRREQ